MILTIGHSNRSFEEFLALLKEFQTGILADVRRFPSSRKFPHFNKDVLQQRLVHHGIEYLWFEALGGRRHTRMNEDSPNTGLESPGFRNYADYMMTDEFDTAVRHLLSMSAKQSTAVMCAERMFWKCHRRLLSDFLLAQGAEVGHILESDNLRPHKFTQNAVITEAGTVLYQRSLS